MLLLKSGLNIINVLFDLLVVAVSSHLLFELLELFFLGLGLGSDLFLKGLHYLLLLFILLLIELLLGILLILVLNIDHFFRCEIEADGVIFRIRDRSLRLPISVLEQEDSTRSDTDSVIRLEGHSIFGLDIAAIDFDVTHGLRAERDHHYRAVGLLLPLALVDFDSHSSQLEFVL